MGTFALPTTDDASQTKCRVNLDLAVWLPRSQAPAQRTAAIQFLDYLMQPSVDVAFASYLMALLPTLVVFLIAQRWVVSGIMRGSIK